MGTDYLCDHCGNEAITECDLCEAQICERHTSPNNRCYGGLAIVEQCHRWVAESKNGKISRFIAELVQMKDRAGRLGLWKTMHALDEATKAVGYEYAEILEKDKK